LNGVQAPARLPLTAPIHGTPPTSKATMHGGRWWPGVRSVRHRMHRVAGAPGSGHRSPARPARQPRRAGQVVWPSRKRPNGAGESAGWRLTRASRPRTGSPCRFLPAGLALISPGIW